MTGHDEDNRCRQCCSRLVYPPGGETGQGFFKQHNTLRSGIANGNEATRSALCIVRFRHPLESVYRDEGRNALTNG